MTAGPRKDGQPAKPACLLGIESSGPTCAVGLSSDGRLLAEQATHIRHIHSRRLTPMIDDILAVSNHTYQDLKAIILSAGPGSFTGLRIGYSVAKGLAHALNIPIVEVSTLLVWARQCGEQPLPLCPVIDAHRGEIFAGVYRWQEAMPETLVDDQLLSPDTLPEVIAQPVMITGSDGLQLADTLLPALPDGSRVHRGGASNLQIWSLLALGEQYLAEGRVSDTAECEPRYLRSFQGVS